MKRLNGVKKRRQKRDGLKRPKTHSQTHSQTRGQTHSQKRGQTRGQTQIQAGLNAQETHLERVYPWRLKKPGTWYGFRSHKIFKQAKLLFSTFFLRRFEVRLFLVCLCFQVGVIVKKNKYLFLK